MSEPTDKMIQSYQATNWDLAFLMSDAFRSFLDLLPEAAILSNEQGEVILTNTVAQQLFKYTAEEFVGVVVEELVPKKIRGEHAKFRQWFFENPKPRFLKSRNLDLCACTKYGDDFPMESALFAIKTDQGTIAVNLLRDISSQMDEQKDIYEYAFVDALTNLPNLRFFKKNLKITLARAKRLNNQIGLLYIDLDGFKPVNDTYGHALGDIVLQETSARLAGAIREEDMLARVGGDEFIALIYPADSIAPLNNVAERIMQACEQPISAEGHTFRVTASIGGVISSKENTDPQKLIHVADRSMYQAKKQGGNCFVFSEQ
ncbi:MAG: GGDEF domain-containing protein [Coxiellaceae bacterium]|nr:GGDEF domain-containing protein [Coxiellaceae bacterium]